MRLLRHTDADYPAVCAALDRRAAPAESVRETVSAIIADVRARGDAAVLELTARFGGPTLDYPGALRVTEGEFRQAARATEQHTQRALAEAHENVRAFAGKSLRRDWHMVNRQGAVVGERFTPFGRVGLYVPGGSAPLVSTAIMTCTLAQTAGVREIVVTTPAGPDGTVAPALLCALELAGATEVYKCGGAQAVAALAFGTGTIRAVDKIFGPGNAYVVEAKRQVFGPVAIDLLPGPSEVLVLADGSARADWIAADLLAQAEHGADSAAGLVTDSEELLRAVQAAVGDQLAALRRQAQLGPALEGAGSFLLLTRDLDEAIAVVNRYAPEHLSVATADPEGVAARITSAGCIFLGGWSPVAAGDFLAGPSHTLPTGGAGKSFAGLTTDQFQRRTSMVRLDEGSLRHSLPIIQAFCDVEGLDAHARSAAIRFDGA